MREALAPLRHREFRLLFAGRVVSFAGSAMAPIALGGCAAIATVAILAQLASREVRELPHQVPRLVNAPEAA